ncbi:MAG: GGDEF domain-containing protein [Succinivibrio sp.]
MYLYYTPTDINEWMTLVMVPEKVAFERVHTVNNHLYCFIAVEILVLIGYFFWLMHVTLLEIQENYRLANYDLLTEIYNRNSYESRLDQYVEQSKNSLSCIYIDANGLHELNNTQGHEAGDRLLITIAKVLMSHFRRRDCFRIGGDEFVVMATDLESSEIEAILEKIRTELATYNYNVSTGFSVAEKRGCNIHELIKDAEGKMYEDKRRYYSKTATDRRKRI